MTNERNSLNDRLGDGVFRISKLPVMFNWKPDFWTSRFGIYVELCIWVNMRSSPLGLPLLTAWFPEGILTILCFQTIYPATNAGIVHFAFSKIIIQSYNYSSLPFNQIKIIISFLCSMTLCMDLFWSWVAGHKNIKMKLQTISKRSSQLHFTFVKSQKFCINFFFFSRFMKSI